MIRITSKRHNFRRCGIPHPKTPVDYPDERFSEEELKILQAERMLTVEVIDDGEIARVKNPQWANIGEIKATLNKLGIKYPVKTSKADLIKLLEEKTAAPPEE